MSIQPSEDAAVHRQPAAIVTRIRPSPPSTSSVIAVGLTDGVQVTTGVDGTPGAAGGVGSGETGTTGVGSGDAAGAGEADAALDPEVPDCTMVSTVPFTETVATRGSVPAFARGCDDQRRSALPARRSHLKPRRHDNDVPQAVARCRHRHVQPIAAGREQLLRCGCVHGARHITGRGDL